MVDHRLLGIAIMSVAFVFGCSNVKPELSKPTETVTWPELQALQNPDVAMGIFRAMQMGDFKTMKASLAKPEVETMIKSLEDSKIPPKFASKAREDAKAKLVTEYRTLVASAKGLGSNQDLKRSGQAVLDAIAKVMDPALK